MNANATSSALLLPLLCASFLLPGHAAAETLAQKSPDAMRLGLGVGWHSLSQTLSPSLGVVRLRMPGGWAVEPAVALRHFEFEDMQSGTHLDMSTALRLPLATRSKVELAAIGKLAYSSNLGGEEDEESSWAASVSWGLGIERFIASEWSLGVNATSPLLTYQRFGMASSKAFGPIFAPRLDVLATLYF